MSDDKDIDELNDSEVSETGHKFWSELLSYIKIIILAAVIAFISA